MLRERFTVNPSIKDLFTPRQWQILEGIAMGLNEEQIAEGLGIDEKTVAHFISGTAGDSSLDGSRTEIGILGIIEAHTDERPTTGNLRNHLLLRAGVLTLRIKR